MARRDRGIPRLLGRLAMVAGGVTLALRLALPSARTAAVGLDPGQDLHEDADSGRGHPATPPSRPARRAGHETEDMSGWLMARLALMLMAVAACVAFGMVGLRAWVTSRQLAERPSLTALQTEPVRPPAPGLQADPVAEIDQLRKREDALLGNYAWADAAHTRARIPIGRAMELIAGHGLEHAP